MNSNEKIYVTQSSMPPYEEYINAIKPLWDSHWLTNMGEYHKEFESRLKEYLDVPEVSLMVNGHMALELAIQAMDFPAGSEVITTPFTFISTTHAIIRNKLEPVFCDVKETDGTIDENKIEQLITDKTVAIVPVHVYGNICNVKEIDRIAKRYGLKVIYDAAHAFGEKYQGIGVANYGDVSVFSFHATKVFNTIEGGAVAFRSHDLYEKLYNLKNFGIRGEELVVDIGANAKMNEFAAIMGLCNLKYIEEEISKRRKIVEYYMSLLKDAKELVFFERNKEVDYNYAYFIIRIKDRVNNMTRNEIYDLLKSYGIMTRKYFYPITSEQKCFGQKYFQYHLPIAKKISEQVLALPLYAELDEKKVEKIVNLLLRKRG